MSFQWPYMLAALALVPLLVALYLWLLGRRRRFAVGFSDISLIREAMAPGSHWRRHLPAVVLLASLTSALFGLSRPTVSVDVPLSRTSIILALDVSRSMCATDIEPNRLTVAQDAAIQFVEAQADRTKIGIVAFAGFSELIVPPTNDSEQLTDAIAGFNTSFGTAMGGATLRAIDALAEINPDIVAADAEAAEGESDGAVDRDDARDKAKVPDVVVVLTDGANTQGVDPLIAAEMAADRRVRVYTIGFGTTEETTMVCNPDQAGADFIADPFGEQMVGDVGPAGDFGQIGGFGGTSQFLIIDEPTLQSVASITGGAYFRAEDADQLLDVFLGLPDQFLLEPQEVEISWAFVALSALLACSAVGLSARHYLY